MASKKVIKVKERVINSIAQKLLIMKRQGKEKTTEFLNKIKEYHTEYKGYEEMMQDLKQNKRDFAKEINIRIGFGMVEVPESEELGELKETMKTKQAIATANEEVIRNTISEKDETILRLEEQNRKLQEIIKARDTKVKELEAENKELKNTMDKERKTNKLLANKDKQEKQRLKTRIKHYKHLAIENLFETNAAEFGPRPTEEDLISIEDIDQIIDNMFTYV